LLKEPGDSKADIPTTGSKPTRADRFAILPQELLKAMVKLATLLKDLDEEWAIGGDAGELVQGVNVPADHLEILTTKKGCVAINTRLSSYQTLAPKETEKTLDREAMFEGQPCPAYVKSEYAEFVLDSARVEVYGDLRIKVGERDWSDPLSFEATEVNVVGNLLPLVPLELKSKMYAFLGPNWADRVRRISEAVLRSRREQRSGRV